jgi:hypothetical protein
MVEPRAPWLVTRVWHALGCSAGSALLLTVFLIRSFVPGVRTSLASRSDRLPIVRPGKVEAEDPTARGLADATGGAYISCYRLRSFLLRVGRI